jgi:hypothetical protein
VGRSSSKDLAATAPKLRPGGMGRWRGKRREWLERAGRVPRREVGGRHGGEVAAGRGAVVEHGGEVAVGRRAVVEVGGSGGEEGLVEPTWGIFCGWGLALRLTVSTLRVATSL